MSVPFLPQLRPSQWRDHVNMEVLQLLHTNPALVRLLEKKSPAKDNDEYHEDGTAAIAAMAAAMSTCVTNEGRRIAYSYGHKQVNGRLYVKKVHGCLQRMHRYLRHALCHGVLRDWDLVNSYFAICKDLCRMMSIPCPMIDEYVDNREAVFRRLGMSKDEAKPLLLSLLMGKAEYASNSYTGYLGAFAEECKLVSAAIMKAYPEEAKKRAGKANKGGKTLSAVLAIFENGLLNVMVKKALELGVEVCVLMLDGFMSRGPIPEDFAQQLTAAIQQTGFTSVHMTEKEIPCLYLPAMAQEAGIQLVLPETAPNAETVAATPAHMPRGLLVDILHRFIWLCASMGTGKTERQLELILDRLGKGWTVLVLTQRKAMVDSYTERAEKVGITGFSRYDKFRGFISPAQHPHAVVEWESIQRISGTYDLIIFDEFRSIVSTMNSRTNGEGGLERETHLRECVSLLRYCKQALFMDADLSVDAAAEDVLRAISRDLLTEQATEQLRLAARQPEALAKAVQLQAAADNPDIAAHVHQITWQHRTMSRAVRQADTKVAMAKLKDLVSAGKRVGVCVLSKAEAIDMCTILDPLCSGCVSVYYGGSENMTDVRNLNEMWNKYQVIIFTACITTGADYNGPVEAVFAFPSIGLSTPRDMHQMVGRFRNVVSNEVWLGVTEQWSSNIEGITRESLRSVYEEELLRLRYGHKLVQTFTEAVKDRLAAAFRATPGSVALCPNASIPLMQVVSAHSNAERVYCSSGGKWLSYFRYMADLKGYGWNVLVDGLDKEQKKLMIAQKSQAALQRTFERDQSLASIQVAPLLENDGLYDNLQKLGRGCLVKDTEGVMKLLQPLGITKANIRDAALKAYAARQLKPEDLNELNSHTIDTIVHSQLAITCQRILRVTAGIDMTPLYHEAYKAYTTHASDIAAVPPLHVLQLCDGLLKAMGLTGVRDSSSLVKAEKFDKAAVQRAMKLLALARVCRYNGGCSVKVVQGVLDKCLGYKVREGQLLMMSKVFDSIVDMHPPLDMSTYTQYRKTDQPQTVRELVDLQQELAAPVLGAVRTDYALAHAEEAKQQRWQAPRSTVDECMAAVDTDDRASMQRLPKRARLECETIGLIL